jgi:hypothetical protein
MTNKALFKKHEKLANQINEYLINNRAASEKLNKGSLIIPIDETDCEYTAKTNESIKKILKEGYKNVVVAALSVNGTWSLRKVLYQG